MSSIGKQPKRELGNTGREHNKQDENGMQHKSRLLVLRGKTLAGAGLERESSNPVHQCPDHLSHQTRGWLCWDEGASQKRHHLMPGMP